MRKSIMRLSAKRQYDLLGAVRGPDFSGGHTLKSVVTARVRFILFQGDGKGTFFAEYKTRPVNQSDLDALHRAFAQLKKAGTPNDHYTAHLEKAVRATAKHRIWGGYAETLANILRDRQ